MIPFKNYLKADWYKFLKSKIIISHLLIPVIGLILMIMYFTLSSWNEIEKVSAYIQVVSISFPLVISIVIMMVYEQEEETKGFQYFLLTSDKRYIPHISKLLLLFLIGIIATFISIIGFVLLSNIMYDNNLNIIFFSILTFTMFLSNMPLYIIQYLVTFFWGKGASISLGIIGTLIAALLITGIGDGIWFLLPWGFSSRLSIYLFQYIVTNDFTWTLKYEVKIAITSIIIYIIISGIILKKFSDNWEGSKEYC